MHRYTQIEPLCVLDFYIHESCQRQGIGKLLFEYMLQCEKIQPCELAYDAPSKKLLSFLAKYYGLSKYNHQNCHFVIFYDYWEKSKQYKFNPLPTDSVVKAYIAQYNQQQTNRSEKNDKRNIIPDNEMEEKLQDNSVIDDKTQHTCISNIQNSNRAANSGVHRSNSRASKSMMPKNQIRPNLLSLESKSLEDDNNISNQMQQRLTYNSNHNINNNSQPSKRNSKSRANFGSNAIGNNTTNSNTNINTNQTTNRSRYRRQLTSPFALDYEDDRNRAFSSKSKNTNNRSHFSNNDRSLSLSKQKQQSILAVSPKVSQNAQTHIINSLPNHTIGAGIRSGRRQPINASRRSCLMASILGPDIENDSNKANVANRQSTNIDGGLYDSGNHTRRKDRHKFNKNTSNISSWNAINVAKDNQQKQRGSGQVFRSLSFEEADPALMQDHPLEHHHKAPKASFSDADCILAKYGHSKQTSPRKIETDIQSSINTATVNQNDIDHKIQLQNIQKQIMETRQRCVLVQSLCGFKPNLCVQVLVNITFLCIFKLINYDRIAESEKKIYDYHLNNNQSHYNALDPRKFSILYQTMCYFIP